MLLYKAVVLNSFAVTPLGAALLNFPLNGRWPNEEFTALLRHKPHPAIIHIHRAFFFIEFG